MTQDFKMEPEPMIQNQCPIQGQNLPPELQPDNNLPTSVMPSKEFAIRWCGYASLLAEFTEAIEQRDRAIENAAYERAGIAER